jgi:hypothetical protein
MNYLIQSCVVTSTYIFVITSDPTTTAVNIELGNFLDMLCCAAAERADTSAGGFDVLVSPIILASVQFSCGAGDGAIMVRFPNGNRPADCMLLDGDRVTRATVDDTHFEFLPGDSRAKKKAFVAAVSEAVKAQKYMKLRVYRCARNHDGDTSSIHPSYSCVAQQKLRDLFKDVRIGYPVSDLRTKAGPYVLAIARCVTKSKEDTPTVQSATVAVDEAATTWYDRELSGDKGHSPESLVRSIQGVFEALGGKMDNKLEAVHGIRGAAPQGSHTKEKRAEMAVQRQESRLLCLLNAVAEDDDTDLARSMINGDHGADLRIDGALSRGPSPHRAVPSMVGSCNVVLQELKAAVATSRSRGTGVDSAVADADEASSASQAHQKYHAGARDGFCQLTGRFGQGFYALMDHRQFKSADELITDLDKLLPVAMVLADYNAYGAVLIQRDFTCTMGSELGQLPIRMMATALSGLSDKKSGIDGREVLVVDAVISVLFPLLALRVCENGRDGLCIPDRIVAKLFGALTIGSGGRDNGRGDGGSRDEDSGDDDGRDEGSERGKGSSSSHGRQDKGSGSRGKGGRHKSSSLVDGGDSVVFGVKDNLCRDGSVVRCKVESSCCAAPSWLHGGARVIVKLRLSPTELECWRAVEDCVGVPRLVAVRIGGRTAAVTPDGVGSSTLNDWYGGCDNGKVVRRASLEWAQMFIKRLHTTVQALHERGVVHADLHPQNIVVEVGNGGCVWNAWPLLVDFGIARRYRGVVRDKDTHLTQMMMTLSLRGSKIWRQHQRGAPPRWSPVPDDDLQSVVLLGEWLVGNLPEGHATSLDAKRDLMLHARERWGIDVNPAKKRQPLTVLAARNSAVPQY